MTKNLPSDVEVVNCNYETKSEYIIIIIILYDSIQYILLKNVTSLYKRQKAEEKEVGDKSQKLLFFFFS